MKRILKIAIIIILLVAASGGAYYFVSQAEEKVFPAHVGIVLDQSDSVQLDPGCNTLAGLLSRAYKLPGIRRGSRIFIFATGSPATLYEPVQLHVFEIPFSIRVMEGKEAAERKRESATLEAISKCKSLARITKTSPIFLATKRAIAQLRASGCDEKNQCHLQVRTDGEETEEAWLQSSLKAGRALKKGMPLPLDNKNISVSFCGLSEKIRVGEGVSKSKKSRKAEKKLLNPDLIVTLWKKLFIQPDGVLFEPVCPKAEVHE